MVDRPEFERWLAAADRTLESACAEAELGAHNWACFLAEQVAQFAVKGLLHGIGVGAWGHDLVGLGRALSDSLEDALPEGFADALATLSQYYIPTRYPDATPSGDPSSQYTAKHSGEAIGSVEQVLRDVRAVWAEIEAEIGGSG